LALPPAVVKVELAELEHVGGSEPQPASVRTALTRWAELLE
jgi:hypothetical protein